MKREGEEIELAPNVKFSDLCSGNDRDREAARQAILLLEELGKEFLTREDLGGYFLTNGIEKYQDLFNKQPIEFRRDYIEYYDITKERKKGANNETVERGGPIVMKPYSQYSNPEENKETGRIKSDLERAIEESLKISNNNSIKDPLAQAIEKSKETARDEEDEFFARAIEESLRSEDHNAKVGQEHQEDPDIVKAIEENWKTNAAVEEAHKHLEQQKKGEELAREEQDRIEQNQQKPEQRSVVNQPDSAIGANAVINYAQERNMLLERIKRGEKVTNEKVKEVIGAWPIPEITDFTNQLLSLPEDINPNINVLLGAICDLTNNALN